MCGVGGMGDGEIDVRLRCVRRGSDGQDDHPGGGVVGYDRQCEDQDSGQGGDPPGPAATDFCRQAAGGRAHAGGLQHPEGVNAAPGAAAARRGEEEEEEDVHEAEEAEAQEEEGEAGGAAVLQGGRQREGAAAAEGVPEPGLRGGDVHGEPLRPALLREVRADVRVPEGRGLGLWALCFLGLWKSVLRVEMFDCRC